MGHIGQEHAFCVVRGFSGKPGFPKRLFRAFALGDVTKRADVEIVLPCFSMGYRNLQWEGRAVRSPPCRFTMLFVSDYVRKGIESLGLAEELGD